MLLNNTKPAQIRYSIRDPDTGKVDIIDVPLKELKAIEQARIESLQLTKIVPPEDPEVHNEDDWDAEDEHEPPSSGPAKTAGHSSELEKTQSLFHLKVAKPGIINLEQVIDLSTSSAARLHPNEAYIVPCPRAKFVEDRISAGLVFQCAGTKEELSVSVYGVPPLSLCII